MQKPTVDKLTDGQTVVVYPNMPVAVHTGIDWVDDVVSSVNKGDNCPDQSPYFYTHKTSGHWHFGQMGSTWYSMSDGSQSPETKVTSILLREIPGLLDPRLLAREILEFCVIRVGKGITWTPGPEARAADERHSKILALQDEMSDARVHHAFVSGTALQEFDSILTRLREAVMKLKGHPEEKA
jgi:hypothetical protein